MNYGTAPNEPLKCKLGRILLVRQRCNVEWLPSLILILKTLMIGIVK